MLLWILSSGCVTTSQPAIIGTPDGYVMVKVSALADLMESCAICKSELMDCLNREKK